MPCSTSQNNQAIFQQFLIKIAYENASRPDISEPGYDLRGRVIFNLSLNNDHLKQIINEIENPQAVPEGKYEAKTSQGTTRQDLERKLERLIGIKISSTIRCNLDLDPASPDPVIKALIAQRDASNPFFSLLSEANKSRRMSIIPIYEELLCHIEHHDNAVRKRLGEEYEGPLPDSLDNALTLSFNLTKTKIQKRINSLFQQGSPSQLSIEQINKTLDLTRAFVSKELKSYWFKHVKDQLKNQTATQVRIFKALSDGNFKKIHKEIPAHQFTILGTDCVNKTVTLITDSGELTAHNKGSWHLYRGASAARFLIRNTLSRELKVTARKQLSLRVPSVANVKRSAAEDIPEIVSIFKKIHTDFDAASEQNDEPIVYNLLTSLNGIVAEFLDGNHQKESTNRILQGAHRYNAGVVNTGKYIWVQNLAVNRHSDNLPDGGFFSFFASAVHKEAALMADIAMLYTLQHNLPEHHASKAGMEIAYANVLAHYKEFLKQDSSKNFYSSQEGKKAAAEIARCKQGLKRSDPKKEDGILGEAIEALLKIYQNNDHYKEKYGTLIQSLSIFIEKKSMPGCKSANERHEDIQKRTGVLIGATGRENITSPVAESKEIPGSNKDVFQSLQFSSALKRFLDGSGTLDNLSNTLAQDTNDLRMYGDETAVSHSDQEAPSKYQIMAGTVYKFLWQMGSKLAGLGVLSVLGLGLVYLIGMALPPLGFSLWWVSGAVLLLGGLVAVLGVNVPNTNNGCDPLCINNQNRHASKMQSNEGVNFTIKAAKNALESLKPPSPVHWKAAISLFGAGALPSTGLGIYLGIVSIAGIAFPPVAITVLAVWGVVAAAGLVSMGTSALVTRYSKGKQQGTVVSGDTNFREGSSRTLGLLGGSDSSGKSQGSEFNWPGGKSIDLFESPNLTYHPPGEGARVDTVRVP